MNVLNLIAALCVVAVPVALGAFQVLEFSKERKQR